MPGDARPAVNWSPQSPAVNWSPQSPAVNWSPQSPAVNVAHVYGQDTRRGYGRGLPAPEDAEPVVTEALPNRRNASVIVVRVILTRVQTLSSRVKMTRATPRETEALRIQNFKSCIHCHPMEYWNCGMLEYWGSGSCDFFDPCKK